MTDLPKPSELRDKAKEIRQRAHREQNQKQRQLFMTIADEYETLADCIAQELPTLTP